MAFSKSNLLKELQVNADRIQKENGFTIHNGYAQVVGMNETINRAYGEWSCIRSIIESISGGYLGYGDI
jgi:hypothetical protein